jgi:FeS assembly SUF system regulator
VIRLTKLADYGIVLMTRLAAAQRGTVHTARDLATVAGVPLPTVSKILKVLAHPAPDGAALLVSHRGVGGGFALARDAERISVAEVIAALEGPIALTECLGDVPGVCEIEAGCPVRSGWDRINRVVRDALEGLSIAEMARPLKAVRVGTGAP